MSLDSNLLLYINNPKNSEICFDVALSYEKLGQSSSALTFFLKAVELARTSSFQYECLLKISKIIINSGYNRDSTVKALLARSIALQPKRAEAYFLLCQLHEKLKNWHECYSTACIALENCTFEKLKCGTVIGDSEGLLFLKALSAWWIGNCLEGISLMRYIIKNSSSETYKNASLYNISRGPELLKLKEVKYSEDDHLHLKAKFKGYRDIKKNYSECFQDIFVLMCTEGKTKGSFVEVGASHPFNNNNTYLLESQYNWTGVSIDYNPSYIEPWKERKASFINADARYLSWDTILKKEHYDYLQLDCDPSIVTLDILYKIPFDKHTFSVITFEHDYYVSHDDIVRNQSRKYLKSLGYVLLIANVAPDDYRPFEDWYVHPSYVKEDVVKTLRASDQPVNNILDCIFSF